MKYLINKQMRDAIVWMLPDATPIKEMVSELKPIEPLSDAEILRYVYCTPHEGKHYIKFARAVETHILGDKHDS